MISLTQMTVEGLNGFEAELPQFLVRDLDGYWRLVGQHPRKVRRLHETEKGKSVITMATRAAQPRNRRSVSVPRPDGRWDSAKVPEDFLRR